MCARPVARVVYAATCVRTEIIITLSHEINLTCCSLERVLPHRRTRDERRGHPSTHTQRSKFQRVDDSHQSARMIPRRDHDEHFIHRDMQTTSHGTLH